MSENYSSPEQTQANEVWSYVEPDGPEFAALVYQVLNPIAHNMKEQELMTAREALAERSGLSELLAAINDEREKLSIVVKFSLVPGSQRMTLKQMGEELGVSRARVGQIVDRAMNRMRDAALETYSPIDLDNIDDVSITRLFNSKRGQTVVANMQAEFTAPRLINALRRYHVTTVGDLLSRTEDNLYDIINLGRHSVQLAQNVLAEFGLELKSEVNQNPKLRESEFLDMVRARQLETAKRKLGRRVIDFGA